MSRTVIARFCALPTALFLIAIGVVHDAVGLPGLFRAVERGRMAATLAETHAVNWAFSGAARSLLGVLVLVVAPDLRRGRVTARRVAMTIGGFVGAFGVAAWAWVPTQPAVLIFTFMGALLAVPLVVWRHEFEERH